MNKSLFKQSTKTTTEYNNTTRDPTNKEVEWLSKYIAARLVIVTGKTNIVGDRRTTKANLVEQIAALTEIDLEEIRSLEKADRLSLIKLHEALSNNNNMSAKMDESFNKKMLAQVTNSDKIDNKETSERDTYWADTVLIKGLTSTY